jgi:ppGpp synthetase/RelA/SpoT-type nucleotidyltranferase
LSEVSKKLHGTVTDIETKVKDLAGVRIVVYTNSDIARLNHCGILRENFDIVWERTKIHYPRRDSETEQSQFIGRNYVVCLNASRVALTEYKRFVGLQCEVQVQTILDHAWSETAHDTIYKSPKLDGVGAAQMAKIKERMRDIQQKYLLRAGYEFQQVLNDFEHIVSGQHLVESDILASIRDATDNNARVERLEQYATVVLPIIDDKPAAAPEIRSMLIDSARKAAAMAITPAETPIGPMSGRTHEEVLEKILNILADIRYVEPADAYAAYSDLYLVFDEPVLKQKVVDAVGELAKHTLHVWRRFGPAVQEILLDTIAATPQDRFASTRPLMIAVADKCLEPDVTGTSNTSKTFTWETGSVNVSDRMRVVRDRAMATLGDLFTSSRSEGERREIYSAMRSATRLPTHGCYTDPLLERVLTDTCTVIRFLTERADDLGDLLKEKIEHDTLFDYRRAKDMPADVLKDEEVRAARDAIMAAAQALRERFNADGDFVIFKTLVGFESVFEYEWDEDEAKLDFAAKDTFRKERAAEYVAQVREATGDAWFDRLNGYAAIKSEDMAMFPQLGNFIADIAQKSPVIAEAWLDRSRGQPLAHFTPGMLRGLYASDREAALKWISAAIDRKADLSGIAHFIRHVEPASPDLLEKIAKEGIAAEDDAAVYKVLEACAARASEFGMPLARKFAIEAVTFLGKGGRYYWTEPLWIWGKRSGILAQFDNTERAALFAAIRDLPKIDFRAEELLVPHGEAHADEIIDLFGARLKREREEKENALVDDRFEAVPYNFSSLHRSMQRSGPLLLPEALEWHRADPLLGQYKSARLVANIFPELPEDVIKQLIEYARSGDRAAQDFVIDVMSNYDGADVAFTVLKELVAVLPPEDELLRGLRAALGETGVMHGEFGYRDAIVAERERLQSWLADEREPVRLFAEAHIKSLENAIAAAQQDAESDIAMRKLEYGEGLDDDAQANSDQL